MGIAAALCVDIACFSCRGVARAGCVHPTDYGAAEGAAGAHGDAGALALFHVARRRVDRLPEFGASALQEVGAGDFAGAGRVVARSWFWFVSREFVRWFGASVETSLDAARTSARATFILGIPCTSTGCVIFICRRVRYCLCLRSRICRKGHLIY